MRTNLLANLALLAAVITGELAIPAQADVLVAVNAVPSALKAPAAGTGLAPDALLRAATGVVIVRLKQDEKAVTKNTMTIDELMETTVLPLFDFNHMTRLAVARSWKLASPEQQAALIAEFRTLLVRTYSAALINYRDEVIEYKPLLLAPDDTDVTVRSTVKKPGVERMTIDYDMEKTADGWKVYDIRIAGISLTTNYRSSFAEIIRDGGVDELIRYLADRNRAARSGLRSDDSEARGLILLYGVVPSLLGGPQ
jgi:phospholipid transport system substrate-binding protein